MMKTKTLASRPPAITPPLRFKESNKKLIATFANSRFDLTYSIQRKSRFSNRNKNSCPRNSHTPSCFLPFTSHESPLTYHRPSNRPTRRLEIAICHSKQRPALLSNRPKNCFLFFASPLPLNSSLQPPPGNALECEVA